MPCRETDLFGVLTPHEKGSSELGLPDARDVFVELLESRFRARAGRTPGTFTGLAQTVTDTGFPHPVEANAARQATLFATHEGSDMPRRVGRLTGTTTLRRGPLRRCLRNMHAGTQHFFASELASSDMARNRLS